MDAVLVDEIRHSQFANEWLAELRHNQPGQLLKANRGDEQAARDVARSHAAGSTSWSTTFRSTKEDRRHAGF
jgi:hypothetical protein